LIVAYFKAFMPSPPLYVGYALPDPQTFKLFVACVLLYIAWRVFAEFLPGKKPTAANANPNVHTDPTGATVMIKSLHVSLARVTFEYQGELLLFLAHGEFTFGDIGVFLRQLRLELPGGLDQRRGQRFGEFDFRPAVGADDGGFGHGSGSLLYLYLSKSCSACIRSPLT
jgi:hypothetical protein